MSWRRKPSTYRVCMDRVISGRQLSLIANEYGYSVRLSDPFDNWPWPRLWFTDLKPAQSCYDKNLRRLRADPFIKELEP